MAGNRAVHWQKLDTNSQQPTGHIAYYYSDQEAELPVRGVRKQWDSKADPNFETRTYGLFSTCMPPARKNIVDRSDSFIFFFTNWKGQRIFTGYYELGHYIDTGITPRANGKARSFRDFALRAKRVHFVKVGIPLIGRRWSKITIESFQDDVIDAYGPRDFKKIDSAITQRLRQMLDRQKDSTEEYIRELRKLEKENLEKHDFRYPSWHRIEAFSETDFGAFVK